MTTTLTERLADWHHALTVDPDARIVRNVALTGRDSRNGYRYADSALTGAVPLYEGKPVFLDHAADRSRPRDRSTRDLVGTVVEPRCEGGRIRADIRVLDTDAGRTFLALASSNAPGVGMSHVVLARRSADGALVEAIEDVLSVDAVVNPATTTTFRESTESSREHVGGDSTSIIPEDDASPHDEVLPADLSVAELQAEIAQLRSQLSAMEQLREQDVHAQRMDALLSSTNLPDYALTPLFRGLLESAPNEDSRRELIRERRELLRRAARQPPVSHSRARADAGPTDAAFIAAIRRR